MQGRPDGQDDAVVADGGANGDDTSVTEVSLDEFNAQIDAQAARNAKAAMQIGPQEFAEKHAADQARGFHGDGDVELVVVENWNRRLTKAYRSTHDGKTIEKDQSTVGTGFGRLVRVTLPRDKPIASLAALLTACPENQAFMPGRLPDGASMRRMIIKPRWRALPEAERALAGSGPLYRGKHCIRYASGKPALLIIDFDIKDLPDAVRERIKQAGGLRKVLAAIDPRWNTIGFLERPSVSTGIRDKRTGVITPGGGTHLYVIVHDGGDLARYVKALFDRLLLAGFGWVNLSAAGSLLKRSAIDQAASGVGYWLAFEANAVLETRPHGDYLEHVPGARRCEWHEGPRLDTRALPDLTDDEERHVAEVWSGLKAEKEPEARAIRLARGAKDIARLVKAGVKKDDAERLVLMRAEIGRLPLDDEYWFDEALPSGRHSATGWELLENMDAWFAGRGTRTGADPLEPDYPNVGSGVVASDKAWWKVNTHSQQTGLFVKSQAHGGQKFILAHDAADVVALMAEMKARGDSAIVRLAGLKAIYRQSYLPADQVLAEKVLRKAGLPLPVVLEFGDPDAPELGELARERLIDVLQDRHWDQLGRLRCLGRFRDEALAELRDEAEIIGLGFDVDWDKLTAALAAADKAARARESEREDSVRGPTPAGAASLNAVVWPPDDEFMNPWEKAMPPAWPGGVFPDVIERALWETAERDQLDLSGFGAAFMAAASGAAHKGARLTPYAGSSWRTPPILWTLLIGDSGQRKSALFDHVTRQIKQVHAEHIRAHKVAMAQWKALPAGQKNTPPGEKAYLAADVSVEKLQEWIANNPRGLFYARDELAPWFEFGRYTKGLGAAERAFYLEAYEGGLSSVGRMGRPTTLMDNCALAVLGFIQEDRLADFTGLDKDGLIQRFGIVLMQAAKTPIVGGGAPDMTAAYGGLARLLALGTFDSYRLDAAGEALIRETRALGEAESRRRTNGVGFRGFMDKLHGTHARVALVLHLLDGGQATVIPESTVYRAGRYVNFLWGHAQIFYAGLARSTENITKVIASHLLRHQPQRMSAGNLRQKIAVCRELRTLKDIQAAVEPLVLGGWLLPERATPDNRAWLVRPGLHKLLGPELLAEEQERVEATKRAMNFQGRYKQTGASVR